MVGNGSSHQVSGRPSPAVYRRRRIVVGILALLVAVGLVAGIVTAANALRGAGAAASSTGTEAAAPGADNTQPDTNQTPDATPAPDATASKPPSAAPSPSTAAPALCPAASIGVSATPDALSYAAGTEPVLTMTVTNTGTELCSVNVGTSQMEFIVTSGQDRIFSSMDCQQDSEDLLKTIKPNGVETAKLSWDRLRSARGCADVPDSTNPGTYMFTARLGEISSEGTAFELE